MCSQSSLHTDFECQDGWWGPCRSPMRDVCSNHWLLLPITEVHTLKWAAAIAAPLRLSCYNAHTSGCVDSPQHCPNGLSSDQTSNTIYPSHTFKVLSASCWCHQLRMRGNMKCLLNGMFISPLPGMVWCHMAVIDPDSQKYGRAQFQVLLWCGQNLSHLLPRQICYKLWSVYTQSSITSRWGTYYLRSPNSPTQSGLPFLVMWLFLYCLRNQYLSLSP